MRHLLLIVIVAAAIAAALCALSGTSFAQPECTNVYFVLDSAVDPICLDGIEEGWAIQVTSTATSASAGTCNNEALDNRHTDVEFYNEGCGDTTPEGDPCTIYSTYPLSGKYEILEINGNCMRVCQLCGS